MAGINPFRCSRCGTRKVCPECGGVKRYEYIRIEIDMGDLSELNVLSGTGWKVVAVIDEEVNGPTYGDIEAEGIHTIHFALLERPLL